MISWPFPQETEKLFQYLAYHESAMVGPLFFDEGDPCGDIYIPLDVVLEYFAPGVTDDDEFQTRYLEITRGIEELEGMI